MGNIIDSLMCTVLEKHITRTCGGTEISESLFKQKWEIKDKIGSGGYSEVFRIVNKTNKNLKKAAKRVVFFTENDVKEFYHEIAILENLRGTSESIINMTNLVIGPSSGWIVFDLMDGDAYSKFTKEWSSSPVSKEVEVSTAALELLKAISVCHENGIAHFDVKPQNLLFKSRTIGNSKKIDWVICDFNLSQKFDIDGENRFNCESFTLGYRPPEVILSCLCPERIFYDERTDFYGIGSSVFQMLTEFCAFENFIVDDSSLVCSSEGSDSEDDFFVECILCCNLLTSLDCFKNCVSVAARDFIVRLMMFDPNDRMTLCEALSHPFITRRRLEDIELMKERLEMTQKRYLDEFNSRDVDFYRSLLSIRSVFRKN